MSPHLELLLSPEMGIELIYSFVIILCSLMIYHATKDMYELSSYKGIKYFRQAFLFFAIAYFFRYSIKFFLIFFKLNRILDISPMFFGIFTTLIFLYFGSMAIFYLVYSVMWKKLDNKKNAIIWFNVLAIAISFAGLFTLGNVVYFLLNILMLILVSVVLLITYKDSKKKKGKNLFAEYLLLLIFWVLNIVNTLIPRFLELSKMIIYLASISIFMALLYKVLRRTG